MDSRMALLDLERIQNDDDDTNASDNSFVLDKEYGKEFNNELKFNRRPGMFWPNPLLFSLLSLQFVRHK